MTQQKKQSEKRPLSSAILHRLTNASTFYKALSLSPNNTDQPSLCLEIPLKKLLQKAVLQENRLEKSFTKKKKTPFIKTTKTDLSLLRKENSTKRRIATSKNTMNLRDLSSLAQGLKSQKNMRGEIFHEKNLTLSWTV
ncbi:hypothetical protein [Bartonella senegalensis]|uniref:hypothetical protein n=1 Tax=Bartonella senegalensis TaxID=1468418 RepID=UPI0002ED1F41|nr:hypothetical protein [Bartonella senegalensis]